MLQQYHKATIDEKGKLVLNRDKLANAVSALPAGRYLLSLIKTSDRTIRESQNYYFQILTELSRFSGEEKNDLHEMVKQTVLKGMFPRRKKLTTTALTEDQWDMFIMNLGIWTFNNYEFLI